MVTKEEFDRHKKILDWTFGFIVAVLVVCVIAVITFLLDAWRFHSEAYERFSTALHDRDQQEIVKMNEIIQILQKEVGDLKNSTIKSDAPLPSTSEESSLEKVK